MAEVSGLDMVREIIGQINNLRRLVTINGKKFKWDGKKYVRAVDGKKFTKKELVSFVKDEKFEAPKVPDRKKLERNKSLKTKITDKAKSVGRNFKNTKPQYNKDVINRPLANLRLRIGKPNQANLNPKGTNPTNITNRALQISKSLNPRFTAGGLKALGGGLLQGAKGYGIGSTLDWAAQSLLDRGMRNIEGKQKMSIDDYRAMRDEQIANVPKTLKAIRMHRKASKPQRIIGARGRTTGYIQPEQTGGAIGRSRQDPFITREPQVSYKPEKVVDGPNTGTDSTKKETVDQNKVKVVKAPKEQLKAKTVVKKDKKNSGKSKEQIAWEKKSKNSPARKSGAFTDKELWEQYKKHQKWLKKNNRLKVKS